MKKMEWTITKDESPDVFVIKGIDSKGNAVVYNGYSRLYTRICNESSYGNMYKCTSLRGDPIKRSEIYRMPKSRLMGNGRLIQFVNGIEVEYDFDTTSRVNHLIEYTMFSPKDFMEFKHILKLGETVLDTKGITRYATSSNDEYLIGVPFKKEFLELKDTQTNHSTYAMIHRFMGKDDLCHYLLLKVDGIYVPFLVRELGMNNE